MFLVKGLCRLHDAISDFGYVVGALGLATMTTIYCYEVITRYFLGLATDWANDMFANVLLVTIFAMVPHATRMGQHIAISLLVELLPSMRTALRIFAGVFGVAVCLFAAWMSLEENIRHIELEIVTEQNRPTENPHVGVADLRVPIRIVLFPARFVPGEAVKPKSWITPGRAALRGEETETVL